MNSATLIMTDWHVLPRVPERPRAGEDRDLVEGILSHNAEECFDRLVEIYKDRVFGLAVSVMGPGRSAEAEGLTQEVFLQVHRKLSTFRQESGLSTWLYRITYNLALERRRKARLRFPHQGEEALTSMAAPADATDPVAAAMEQQRKQLVRKALAGLGEPYRTALHLFYWLNCSVAEIADQLGTRPGTVKSYLHRGRKRLAEILKKEQADG